MSALLQHLLKDGATAFTQVDHGDLRAGETGPAAKYGIENIGDRVLEGVFAHIQQVGDNDGASMLELGVDFDTLSRPWGEAAADHSSGGAWGATGTYGVRISAINSTGETVASREVTFTVTNSGRRWQYTWDEVPGATGYKVYRTATPGTYGSSTLRATLGETTSYIDDGGATGAGQPGAANTTGGAGPNYGTAPAMQTDDVVFGDLAVGQQAFYWARVKVPIGTPEIGNRRTALIDFRESD
jgi:hypothetical protein